MPASFFDFKLCKSLLDAAANADFSVLVQPLSVLIVLRHYQVYLAYGLTASIIITFFIGQLYLVQIQHSVTIVHAITIHLQKSSTQTLMKQGRKDMEDDNMLLDIVTKQAKATKKQGCPKNTNVACAS